MLLNSFKNDPIALRCIEERIVWAAIVFSYLFYLTGTLYIVGSLVGWALLFVVVLRTFVSGKAEKDACVPVVVWVWIVGMIVMLIALLVAHAEFGLSTGQTIKSSIGWGKGWALLALFPLLGALASIRPQVIVRACCLLSAQSILFLFIGILFVVIGFQGPLYLSPLKVIGGPISAFEVNLFGLNPETGKPRWPFFAPWAPAAGLLSCLFLVICIQETNRFYRRIGLVGAFVMCMCCQSRAGWAIFLALIPALYMFKNMHKPAWIIAVGLALSMLFIWGEPVSESIGQAHQDIKDTRPDSTRVRSALANLALQRWESEAPIWGHGVVETGPKIVEFMPIGSHHSWYGLLFVKGVVGLVSLAAPIAITLLYFLALCTRYQAAQKAVLIITIFIGYSFFENLEILAYLFWPSFLWLGIVLNPMKLEMYETQFKGVQI